MVSNPNLHSDLPIPPGEYLQEVLDELCMSQAELARRMRRPAQAINEIIRGEKGITPETALQLEEVVDVPAVVWLGLEGEYQLTRARLQELAQLEKEAELLTSIPYSAMVKLGWVRRVREAAQKVREMRRFFGVSSLHQLSSLRVYRPAFRIAKTSASPYVLAVWLRKGEIEAREISTAPFDAKRLREALPEIRALTLEAPGSFVSKIKERLAMCGVAFVLLPHLPGTYAHGATFWLSPRKAVVQMSIRGKWADVFWFSLFHELGHLLLHRKREIFVEDGFDTDPEHGRMEADADAFARDVLIPPQAYREFVGRYTFSPEAVPAFAGRIGVAPGIVVGRLQHDGYLDHARHNGLRKRYLWAEPCNHECISQRVSRLERLGSSWPADVK